MKVYLWLCIVVYRL